MKLNIACFSSGSYSDLFTMFDSGNDEFTFLSDMSLIKEKKPGIFVLDNRAYVV